MFFNESKLKAGVYLIQAHPDWLYYNRVGGATYILHA